MHLHTKQLSEWDPRTKLYLTIKSSLAEAEIVALLSTTLLQAQSLVLLYEFGHGIYPSAQLTLGQCLDYLFILKIDEESSDSRKGRTWAEAEVYRRLWWAVYVMER